MRNEGQLQTGSEVGVLEQQQARRKQHATSGLMCKRSGDEAGGLDVNFEGRQGRGERCGMWTN